MPGRTVTRAANTAINTPDGEAVLDTSDTQAGGAGRDGQGRLAANGLVLDLRDETATLDGARLELRGKPLRLLALLMERAPVLVTKSEIIDAVWDGMSVSDAVMTTAVREIRIALGDDARAPRWVMTAHGRGYRFIPALETDQAAATPSAFAGASAAATSEGAHTLTYRPARSGRISPRLAVLGVLGCLLVVMAAAIGMSALGSRPAAAPEKSVAILTFETLSDDGDSRWFADGLAEEISAALARTPDLRVASRQASLPLESEPGTSLNVLGEALNVAHLVTGTVRREGDRVRVTVSLVEAGSGLQRWADTYDRDFTDILDLQGDIAAHVATVLDTALDPEALQAMVDSGTRSIAAYEAYLRAQAAITEFNRTGDSMSWAAALPLLDRARSIDPGFAEAHALSALVFRYLNTPSLVMAPNALTGEAYRQAYSQRMNAAIEAARDPVQAAAYRAVRDMELFDLDTARDALEAYLEERPNDTDYWFHYSNTLVMLGNHDEALEVVRRLDRTLPATDLENRAPLIQHARKARDYALAADIGRRALAVDPFHSVTLIEIHLALLAIGAIEEAASVNARIQESSLGVFAKLFSDIYQVCASGDGARARELGQTFLNEPRARMQGYYMHRILGEPEAAYDRLRDLDTPGVPGRLREMLFDPPFDARQMPHLARAVEAAGGRIVAPMEPPVFCPDGA